MLQGPCPGCLHTHTHVHSLTYTHSHTLTHIHSLTYTHSHTVITVLACHLLACCCCCVCLSVRLQGVRGYPTIMALSPGSTTWAEYQGDRSAASISSWATGLIGNAAANIKKQADLDTFLAKCGGAVGGGKAGGGSSGKKEAAAASWGLCVLLASDKSSMPSLWKALSQAFKGKVG